MILVVGILGALFERSLSGRGQVVDAGMIERGGSAHDPVPPTRAEGLWSEVPGTNVLDLGTPYYNVYETADGRYITLGGGEPQFYDELLKRLNLTDDAQLQRKDDPVTSAEARGRLAEVFKTRTRDKWCSLLEGGDVLLRPGACLAKSPGTLTT